MADNSPAASRRKFLELALASPACALFTGSGSRSGSGVDRQALMSAPSTVLAVDGRRAAGLEIVREWNGAVCRSQLRHRGKRPVRVADIVLFDVPLSLPAETRLYGEGFQMLTQTGGTLAEPRGLSSYTDAGHYRIPAPDRALAFYGLLTLTPPEGPCRVLAFTSCSRFAGRLQLRAQALQVVLEGEGLEMRPGDTWPLEEFVSLSGDDRAKLLEAVAARLVRHHPRLASAVPPTGWCSWYCFGPKVTSRQVLENLDAIAARAPGLRYVQIDDGYQAAMGDWLETGPAFEGGVQAVLREIRARGFEPAIWVAPFVAESGSRVFREHPDWFVHDDRGAPLRADSVTFGGWRRGPWYALDGTHPAVQWHLEHVFLTMRAEWGCSYFKLDANFWGAMHGGRRYDARATRVEAYRRGMQAIARGAGDAFLLGCNHPIWPSVGLVHGSRSSNDIKRTWERIATTARQNLSRGWQNGRLWWNDPDAAVLSGELPLNEFLFHATAIYATGGLILSGDDVASMPDDRLAILRKLLPPTGVAAQFEDETLRVGIVQRPGVTMACLFNWTDGEQEMTLPLGRACMITDFWSGESLGPHDGWLRLVVAPRSARLLACRPHATTVNAERRSGERI